MIMQEQYLVVRKLHWASCSKRVGDGWYTVVLIMDDQEVLESDQIYLEPAKGLAQKIGDRMHLQVFEDHSEGRNGKLKYFPGERAIRTFS